MNILVLGDVMLDINYISKIERNAPEADIPIHNIININYILGGASNVAFNLKKLNTNVELISIIGDDESGKKIKSLLEENNIFHKLFIDKKRKTTQKNRIFHNNTIKVRYDIEDKEDIPSEFEESILSYIKEKHEQKDKIDAIVISDYNKGVITCKLCKQIIDYSNQNNIYTFIDPKVKDYQKYENCFCFKPNLLEGQEISGKTSKSEILEFIQEKIQCEHVVLTCGKEGLIMNNTTKKSNYNLIKHEDEIKVVDVTGAGDIVLTVLVYIYLKTKNMILAAKAANFIAGKSVQVIGNYSLTKEIIDSSIEKNSIIKSKIIYDYEIEKIQKLSQNKNMVFTNGCFDILHSGHIKNLQFARNQGDLLVVGLNSDASIKRLKGETRPINDIIERSTILSLFEFIDYIIIFEEDSPLSILKELKPKILVKGSEYKKEDIIGCEYVEEVILFDYIANKSTSILINEILKKHE
jgi:D-beta-D-heptose 7-phosphate kinase/D-beta-D-heptose 1-phosphate adenosyltransferase